MSPKARSAPANAAARSHSLAASGKKAERTTIASHPPDEVPSPGAFVAERNEGERSRRKKKNQQDDGKRSREEPFDPAPAVLRKVARAPEKDILDEVRVKEHHCRRYRAEEEIDDHARNDEDDARHVSRSRNEDDESEGEERPGKCGCEKPFARGLREEGGENDDREPPARRGAEREGRCHRVLRQLLKKTPDQTENDAPENGGGKSRERPVGVVVGVKALGLRRMKEKIEAVREGKRILDRKRKRNPDGKENAEDGDERARGFESQ